MPGPIRKFTVKEKHIGPMQWIAIFQATDTHRDRRTLLQFYLLRYQTLAASRGTWGEGEWNLITQFSNLDKTFPGPLRIYPAKENPIASAGYRDPSVQTYRHTSCYFIMRIILTCLLSSDSNKFMFHDCTNCQKCFLMSINSYFFLWN